MKKKTTSQLKKQLDKLFSIYIRQRDASKIYALNDCVCCGITKHWSELQAGHYISRSHLSLRYDERNVWPCCVSCNIFKNGNMPAFAIFLENKFGKGILQKLDKIGREITKDFPYAEKIKYYQALLDSS